jgi:PadR family transcriptional regulator, regulatory protein PadR
MKKDFLGEFEELVLTIAAILGEDTYGNSVVNEIKERLHRAVTLSSVHITLYRLEDKGYLRSDMGSPTEERGGRRKRIFTVTNTGWTALRTMKQLRTNLWKSIPQLK